MKAEAFGYFTEVDTPDRSGRSVVRLMQTFSQDGTRHCVEVHRDKFDVNDSWRRDQFLGALPDDADAVQVEQEILDTFDRLDGASAHVDYSALTCAELDAADYRVDYLVERCLVAGQPCILAGPKKSLKTSLLCDLAISLATGGRFLRSLKCTQSTVGFMSGESGLSTLQETLRRVAAVSGYALADVEGLFVTSDVPKFGALEHIDALRRFIVKQGIEVLLVDPAYMAMPSGDNGNLFAQGELLRSASELCSTSGVTLILCHHTKRGVVDPHQPPELDDIAWAGFSEWARQWILVGRRDRYEPGSGAHRLWLNCGGSAGHSSLWGLDVDEGAYDGQTPRHWSAELITAEEARERAIEAAAREADSLLGAKLTEARADVVGVLSSLPDHTATPKEIQTRIGCNRKRLDQAIASLIDDNTVALTQVTKGNNRPYDAIVLVNGRAS